MSVDTTQGAKNIAHAIKLWFKRNDWPQKITHDWSLNTEQPHGPWASQICGLLKADGYNPKAEFFLALADFNRFVSAQDLVEINDSVLHERLNNAFPFCHDNGEIFNATDFWSLYAGIIPLPQAYALTEDEEEALTTKVNPYDLSMSDLTALLERKVQRKEYD